MFESGRIFRIEIMFRKTVLLIFAGIFLLMVSSSAIAKPILRIAYPVFPPFHWVKKNGEMTGFFYDILIQALEKRMGLTVVWTAYPWPRCQENLKSGKDDAVITVPTAERAEFTVTHNTPFYLKKLNLFTYVDHPRFAEIKKIKTIADLKAGEFSVITYIGNSWHKENVQSMGIRTYESSSLENVWKMLAEKRGDIVIEWPPGAWPDIRRADVSQRVVDAAVQISVMPFHLLIRKDSPLVNILPEFDKTIQTMMEDGTMELILSQYY
jgi:polar amino acid transport system substrate-binding protein